ncbi:MAG: DUF6144 family protein [Clostridia bacterium]|nr:DUF6144 family protein [Clostridia bacterium]
MSEQKNRQAIRLYESVSKVCGEQKADAILSELPLYKSPTESKRRLWACASCAKLHEHFDNETVAAIRKGCHCKPSPDSVKELKKCFKESETIEQFVQKANVFGAYFSADNDSILLTYPKCYCPFLKDVKGSLPTDWCMCSLGYAEELFASVTGKTVRTELLESVIQGSSRCVIRITLDQ